MQRLQGFLGSFPTTTVPFTTNEPQAYHAELNALSQQVLEIKETLDDVVGEQISAELLTEITETLQSIETLIAGGQGVDSSAEVESVVSDIEEIKSILSKHFSRLE